MLQPYYSPETNSYVYFPVPGQKVNGDVVCTILQPKVKNSAYQSKDLKFKMMALLKSMSISELVSISNQSGSNFTIDPIRTKVPEGKVTGIKIHLLKKENLVSKTLQGFLEQLRNTYNTNYILPNYQKISGYFGHDYAIDAIQKYFKYGVVNSFTNQKYIKNCTYIVELEVSSEHKCELGDKLCNRSIRSLYTVMYIE